MKSNRKRKTSMTTKKGVRPVTRIVNIFGDSGLEATKSSTYFVILVDLNKWY